ncbi:protein of unknown function [Methylocaldum szegediense]|uniref:Uncharacterized protein n=1 Tax=Methylocaldum szegediense TaxID=73780 RepID=A0ABM9I6L6_9GAMM|nr:protein of unknown function [Methylocaldum szegediense]
MSLFMNTLAMRKRENMLRQITIAYELAFVIRRLRVVFSRCMRKELLPMDHLSIRYIVLPRPYLMFIAVSHPKAYLTLRHALDTQYRGEKEPSSDSAVQAYKHRISLHIFRAITSTFTATL